VAQFVLENEWLRAEFHPRGAALSRLIYKPLSRDIVLTCDDHTAPHHYTNTIVGPIANRISNGRYTIGDKIFQLDQNEGTTCLHGGVNGLSEHDWVGQQTAEKVNFEVNLQGGQGKASYTASYQLIEKSLHIDLSAISDQDSAFNLVPHLYFTLGAQRVELLTLMVNAEKYLPVDARKSPTGEINALENSGIDLRTPLKLGSRIIDHNFCLNKTAPTATLAYDGLSLLVETNAEGLQIYTADHLGRTAVAIEPQGWPDAVNQSNFPTSIVAANSPWSMHSKYEICEFTL
jgi:aldose 1-epimerase